MKIIGFVAALFTAWFAYPASAAAPSFVEVDGGRLAYESCSPTTATQNVILIHDGMADSSVRDGLWPILCRQFLVVRFDKRGYGNSPQSTKPYSSIDDIGAVMKTLHIPSAALIAASANAGRAMAFALAHPDAVDALIVSGPSVPGVPYSEDFIKQVTPLVESVMKGDTAGAMAVVEKCPFCVAPGNTEARQKLMTILRAHPQDLQMRPLEKPSDSIVERLGDLKARTLIIVGDADHASNLNHARVAHEKIPKSVFVTMKNAGHLPYLEHPKEFAEIVTKFLNGP